MDWLKRTKKAPNLTKLVPAKMPKGRGRKGCLSPRKRRKKVAIHSCKLFAEEQASIEEHTKLSNDSLVKVTGHRPGPMLSCSVFGNFIRFTLLVMIIVMCTLTTLNVHTSVHLVDAVT